MDELKKSKRLIIWNGGVLFMFKLTLENTGIGLNKALQQFSKSNISGFMVFHTSILYPFDDGSDSDLRIALPVHPTNPKGELLPPEHPMTWMHNFVVAINAIYGKHTWSVSAIW